MIAMSPETADLIDCIRSRRKARSLLPHGCMIEKPKEAPECDPRLWPWPKLHEAPKPSGTRCLTYVRDQETKLDALVPGTVIARRRGWVLGLNDEKNDSGKYDMAYTGDFFTRDRAGLYLVRTDTGHVTFGHEWEMVWGEEPQIRVAA